MSSKIHQYRKHLELLHIISPHVNKRAKLIPLLPPYWKYYIHQMKFYYEFIINGQIVIKMCVSYPNKGEDAANDLFIWIDISNQYIQSEQMQIWTKYFEMQNIEIKWMLVLIETEEVYRINIKYANLLDIPVKIGKIKQYLQKIYLNNDAEYKNLWTCFQLTNTRGLTKRWYRTNDELTVSVIFDRIYFRYTINPNKYNHYIHYFNEIMYDAKIAHYYADNKAVFVVPRITESTTMYEKVEHYWIFLAFLLDIIEKIEHLSN